MTFIVTLCITYNIADIHLPAALYTILNDQLVILISRFNGNGCIERIITLAISFYSKY